MPQLPIEEATSIAVPVPALGESIGRENFRKNVAVFKWGRVRNGLARTDSATAGLNKHLVLRNGIGCILLPPK